MRKCIAILILVIMLYIVPTGAHALTASSAILMEAETGKVLSGKNAEKKMPMASTTKIMTAILAIENGDLDSVVTVSKNASGKEGSSIWLSVNEHMTLNDMLYGLMLSSGNDAAIAIAEHIGGSVDQFVDMMNQKAEELGAFNTHFTNPNGLPNDDHYTTAHDLGVIACYAMQNKQFVKIASTERKEISWEGHEYKRVLKNKNKMLWQYSGSNGIKTGYTKEAGKCLVSAAKRKDLQLVTVVLKAGDMWQDSKDLLDYGFENYVMVPLVNKDEITLKVTNGVKQSVQVAPVSELSLPLKKKDSTMVDVRINLEEQLTAPVRLNQSVGSVEVLLEGETIASVPIVTKGQVAENTYIFNLRNILANWLHRSGFAI